MSLELLGARLGADATQAPSLDEVRAGRAVIRQGMRGPAVEFVQRKAGLTGSAVDGMFGPGTTTAVKAFQRGMELQDDGIVGRDTLEALDGAYIVEEKAPAVPGKPNTGAPQLSTGVKAAAVGGMILAPILIGGAGLLLLAGLYALLAGEER